MKNYASIFFTYLFLLSMPSTVKAQLIINEIMQSNIDGVFDNLNQFPDSWVELYNPGNIEESLSDYCIGEKADASKAWKLPKGKVSPKGYCLIYCDNEANGLHTDFRLDTDKNFELHLFKNGVVVDTLGSLKKMPAPHVGYGREKDASDKWGYELNPTPGSINKGGHSDIILGEPVFSHEGCVMKKGTMITLTITPPDDAPEGTRVLFTTDGSEPSKYGQVLAKGSSIHISSNKIVRAKLTCEECISPRSTTQSYIFLDREMTLPVVSIATNDEYLYDDKKGIYVKGSYNSEKANYEYNWRRPVNIELFEQFYDESVINQLCEARTAGAASRSLDLKSLAIYANERFGKKKFKYEFFPDQREGQKNYRSLVLRNAGNDFHYLYLRDALCQRVMAEHADIDWQAWRPVIFYLNGVYKGILNIRERGNDHNIYTNYNELEDVDVVENWYSIKKGTGDNLNAFRKFYKEEGHTWDEFSEWMDCDEFINIMIMNCYFGNIDYPSNNNMMWRPHQEGGRWRWIAKDVDYTIGIYWNNATRSDFNYIKWLYTPGYEAQAHWGNTANETLLFRRLMEDETFARRFIDRYLVYMGDFLNLDAIWKIWEPMYEMIRTEYPIHRKLFNEWWPNYGEEMSKAQEWIKERNGHVMNHLQEQYELGSIVNVKVNDELTDNELQGIRINMNEVDLSNGRFDGSWYVGRKVMLSATSEDDNNKVTGWKVTYHYKQSNKEEKTEVITKGASFSLNIINNDLITINAITQPSADIENSMANVESHSSEEFYDLQGRRVTTVRHGQWVIDAKKKRVVVK